MGKTAWTKIYNFEFLSGFVNTENILWLHITMNYFVFLKKDESLKQLIGIRLDLRFLKTCKSIVFQVLKQVSVEQLKYKALVISEVDMLVHPHYIMLIVFVLLHQEL